MNLVLVYSMHREHWKNKIPKKSRNCNFFFSTATSKMKMNESSSIHHIYPTMLPLKHAGCTAKHKPSYS